IEFSSPGWFQIPAMSAPLSVRTEPLGCSVIRGDPYTVWVLKEGYCVSEADGSCRADGSITLLTGPLVVLVDTGGPWDRQLLLDRLAERGVQPGDVSHVICTHGHSDHVGNLNLFPGATLAVACDVSQGDRYLSHGLGEGRPLALDPHVEVLPTPGHAGRDTSVLVRGCEGGLVLVAGDLFESEGDEESWRGLSQDPAMQERSRQGALEIADIIIPGHGPPFRVYRDTAAPPK
ncbi:metallo-beta-lactamase domain-containing protein 1-like, partial [Huso huso]